LLQLSSLGTAILSVYFTINSNPAYANVEFIINRNSDHQSNRVKAFSSEVAMITFENWHTYTCIVIITPLQIISIANIPAGKVSVFVELCWYLCGSWESSYSCTIKYSPFVVAASDVHVDFLSLLCIILIYQLCFLSFHRKTVVLLGRIRPLPTEGSRMDSHINVLLCLLSMVNLGSFTFVAPIFCRMRRKLISILRYSSLV